MLKFNFYPYRFYKKSIKNIFDKNIKLNIEYYLQQVLEIEKYQFYLDDIKRISYLKYLIIYNNVSKLRRYYPVEYLLKLKSFLGMDIIVVSGVLVPRIETEKLVELILKEVKSPKRILDIGCGSGNILVSLKKNNVNYELEGIDISKKAIKNSMLNIKKYSLKNIKLTCTDVKKYSPTRLYDVVVSNPPYISEKEKNLMGRDVLKYEPHIALFSELDGYGMIDTIINRLPFLLKKGGQFYLECGFKQAETIQFKMVEWFDETRIIKDIFSKDRYIVGYNFKG